MVIVYLWNKCSVESMYRWYKDVKWYGVYPWNKCSVVNVYRWCEYKVVRCVPVEQVFRYVYRWGVYKVVLC